MTKEVDDYRYDREQIQGILEIVLDSDEKRLEQIEAGEDPVKLAVFYEVTIDWGLRQVKRMDPDLFYEVYEKLGTPERELKNSHYTRAEIRKIIKAFPEGLFSQMILAIGYKKMNSLKTDLN